MCYTLIYKERRRFIQGDLSRAAGSHHVRCRRAYSLQKRAAMRYSRTDTASPEKPVCVFLNRFIRRNRGRRENEGQGRYKGIRPSGHALMQAAMVFSIFPLLAAFIKNRAKGILRRTGTASAAAIFVYAEGGGDMLFQYIFSVFRSGVLLKLLKRRYAPYLIHSFALTPRSAKSRPLKGAQGS